MTHKKVVPALALSLAALSVSTVEAQTSEDLSQAAPPVTQDFKPALEGNLLGSLPPLELGGDGRRTLGRFVPNLGRNLAGFLGSRNAGTLGLGATVAGVGVLLDRPAQNYFAQRPRAEEFGELGSSVGGAKFLAPMTLGLFMAGRVSHDTRFRAATYDLGQAMIVTQVYTTGLKMTVGRNRPDGSNRLSFPSGHTASAFTFASVADHYYGRRAGIFAYTAAGLIGLSRMERNKHHASDVLAGAALGWVSARTVIRKDGDTLHGGRRLSLTPMAAPSGSGVGLGLSLSF